MKVEDTHLGGYGIITQITKDMILCDWFEDEEFKKESFIGCGYTKEKFERFCEILEEDIQRTLE